MEKYSQLFLATTDTVTGIGAPISKANFKAIYDLKQRSKEKPLIIMVGSLDQARKFKEWDRKAEAMAEKHWPGAVTLVLSDTTAIRMPDSKPLCSLILELGPVYMTSANVSGGKTMTLEEAKEYFQEINSYYDFGKGSGRPSKIIRVKDGEVLR